VKCTAWGRTAELIVNHIYKGDKVFLVGQIELPELFTKRNGEQGLAEQFTVKTFERFTTDAAQQDAAATTARPASPPEESDDIPF
jgi:hypothetical protein